MVPQTFKKLFLWERSHVFLVTISRTEDILFKLFVTWGEKALNNPTQNRKNASFEAMATLKPNITWTSLILEAEEALSHFMGSGDRALLMWRCCRSAGAGLALGNPGGFAALPQSLSPGTLIPLGLLLVLLQPWGPSGPRPVQQPVTWQSAQHGHL